MPNKTKASTATVKSPGKIKRDAKPAAAAPEANSIASSATKELIEAKAPSRLAVIVEHLREETGASIAELCSATGWQAHSIRGAMAGALKRKGHIITSSVVDGVRRYAIAAAPR